MSGCALASRQRATLSLARGFLGEAEIKHLARWNFFDGGAKSFLGKLDGVFHPRFVNRSIHRLAGPIAWKKKDSRVLLLTYSGPMGERCYARFTRVAGGWTCRPFKR